MFYVLGGGKLKLAQGIRVLTDDEERWLAIGCGLDKTFVCEFDSENAFVIQTTQKLSERVKEQFTVTHWANFDRNSLFTYCRK